MAKTTKDKLSGTASDKHEAASGRPRIVILGGGFAGLNAARGLRGVPADITVIDRTNHHLFQPLLYQVATAALAPTDITAPIRHLLRKQKNARVLLAEVKEIDAARGVVLVRESGPDNEDDPHEIPFDYLVIATGARHSYFGHDEWEPIAPGLKSIADATEIRQRFLLAFERAEMAQTDEERRAALTFVIIGAGPTGCELAGTLPEIARRALRSDFRNFDTRDARVILIEALPRILSAFPENLAEKAKQDLERLGVEIRVGAPVAKLEEGCVYLKNGDTIPTETIIWGAGNAASPIVKSLGVPLDKAGRVIVEPDLSVPGHANIFVAGDLAAVKNKDGSPVPAVAPAAMQMGDQVAKNITHSLYREGTEPFHYWNKGNLAVIGRGKAIADFGFLRVSGLFAWLLWLFVHLMFLVGFRNRASVLLQWAFAYLTFERGARLINEQEQRTLGQTAPEKATIGAWGS